MKEDNIFSENKGNVSLEDMNTLMHSYKYCFAFPEGFKQFQKAVVELFKSYELCQNKD